MSKLCFVKYQGAGNDFILIDDRQGTISLSESEIKHLCHRQYGIGADGLILLQMPLYSANGVGHRDRFSSGVQKVVAGPGPEGLPLRMRVFNSDGRECESCGNGLRCFGRFLLDLGFPRQNTLVSVHDRTVEILFEKGEIGVDMGEPRDLKLNIPTEQGVVHYADTGVPHVVHFVNDLERARLEVLGPFWRSHSLFAPRGANVNLACIEGPLIRVRTFERGVEGETLACGSGACAVAAIASRLYGLQSPIPIHFSGGILEIFGEQNRLKMFGPALKVFEGIATTPCGLIT